MVLLREGRYATAPTPIPSGGAYKKPLEARAPTINRVIEIAGLALATLALTFGHLEQCRFRRVIGYQCR
jgi:hypothetical protein